MGNKMKNLKILSWNAAGIENKKHEFLDLIEEKNIDIFLIQETFLKPCKKFGIANYIIHRTDRLIGRGGGTLIGVKKEIKHNRINNLDTKEIENTAIEIKMDGYNYTIISAYLSPSKKITEQDLDSLFNNNKKIILGGDLNAKNTTWNCRVTNPKGRTLQQHSSRNNYFILSPDLPTHFDGTYLPDILDIFITKDIGKSFNITTENSLSSDHNPVILSTEDWLHIETKDSYNKIYWRIFKIEIEKIEREVPELTNTIDLESEIKLIENEIKNATSLATREKKISKESQQLPIEIKNMIKEKNRLQKRVRLLNYPPDKVLLTQIRNIIKKEISSHRNEKWEKIIETISEEEDNNKSLWLWKKKISNKTNKEQPLHSLNGLVYTDKSKADCFSDILEKQFSLNRSIDDDIDHEEWVEERAQDIESTPFIHTLREVTDEEIKGYIAQAKPKKAPGHDGITNRHLKNLPDKYIKYLTNIFNSMLKLGHFPDIWKNAIVVMIPKYGLDGKFPQNHRPISLLSALSKLGEKVIRTRLNEDIEEKHLIPDEQFGFRQRYSTEGQALRLAEGIYNNIEYKKHTAALFMDISKAFDKVWHDGLILKLHDFDISQELIVIIASFLRNRTFQVRQGNELSDIKPIEAGVPQGAVLSPTLYDLYTADIPHNIPNTKLFTYADDTAIIAYSKKTDLAIKYLQSAVDEISSWLQKWKIKINPDKSQPVLFSRRVTNTNKKIEVQDKALEWKETAKYLGVRFDKRLTWACHIQQVIDKMEMKFHMLSPFLYRRSKMNLNNKILLYKQIIRPTALYGSAVWGSAALSHLRLLDTCENKILRKMANARWFVRNQNIHRDLKINTISEEIKSRNNKILPNLAQHENPLLQQALNYDPSTMRRTRRPMECLQD